ncbi:MAG: UDP-N-acetylmuramoyl-L-alanyl-D-glutamate--2,6-diaminopimelate ligase [Anaerolineaceae bacterium]|nr:UDP-N-acetylmuramoyl-L-alanyl-D-glutamate--2,6-diaminopimelate ligase [Anaerolineaceae bacterium]
MIGFVKQTMEDIIGKLPCEKKIFGNLKDIPVTGIVFDSREVKPGNIFVAFKGERFDGHEYIKKAIDRGAGAIVGIKKIEDITIPYIQVKDSRFAMAHLAAAFYDYPGRKMMVIGVTGTEGKTTTSSIIYEILLAARLRAGIISTVSAVFGDESLDTGLHVTTPEAIDVQRYLSRMLVSGISHVVLETTSHGLDQHRVTGCEFDVGVVTNITHDHLDYHGTYEEYQKAKGKLFEHLGETQDKESGNPRLSILNKDDQSFQYLKTISSGKIITYGLVKGNVDLWAENIELKPSGLFFDAVSKEFRLPISCKLIGDYNLYNCLAAIGATRYGANIELEDIQAGIASLKGVSGRMEQINLGQKFMAIVDFAHSPNALVRSLESIRKITSGRIITVFGSAGLRDHEKRGLMAEVSLRLADLTILTAEDPRTESLSMILEQMSEGANREGGKEGVNYWRVPDRGDALRFAVKQANPGDVVVTLGKGHEQSMCFGEIEYPWDDRTALRAALSEYLGISGPEMPSLPQEN